MLSILRRRFRQSDFIPLLAIVIVAGFSEGKVSRPKIIDLTHWWDQRTMFPPTNVKNFTLNTYFRKTTNGIIYQSETIELGTNGGTHLVSPAFLLKGRATAAQITLDRLFLPIATVNISQHVMRDQNYQMRIMDVKRWEDSFGKLPQGGLLMVNTGWSRRFWGDATKYYGISKTNQKVKNMHFPGIHPETAEWLVSQRQLAAVAIDAPSVDHGFSKKFDSQRIFLSGNVYLINNVDHVWTLPPASATAFVFPMKIKHAAVVPIRLMALVP